MATKKKVITRQPKQGKLRDYELVFVVSPEVAEEALDGVIEGVNQFITARQGVVEETTKWGRRRLAYPIKRSMEGNYVLARVKMTPEATKDLEASLMISEQVLRHLLVNMEN
ncbi:MAG: 30S ribosomal protein S6 [Chloroflexota bacterium]